MMYVIKWNDKEEWNTQVHSFKDWDVYFLCEYAVSLMLHGDGFPYLFLFEDSKMRMAYVMMLNDLSNEDAFKKTFEEGKYAVTITGNDSVGGIIGDPGVISSAGQSMITMIGTNISNSLIKGTTNADYLVGIHGRFSTTYSGTQVETITSSNYTDCKTEIK